MNKNNQRRINELRIQAELKKRKKQNRDVFLAKLLFFLIVFAFLCIIAIICISCQHNGNASTPETNDKITVDNGDEKPIEEASLSSYIKNGVLYVNFTELAKKCEMTISGTNSTQTFSIENENAIEYMTLTADSYVITVNDQTIHTLHPPILDGDDMWLSVEFVSNVVHGITVKYDEENNTLICKRTELNASTKDNPLYESVYFSYNITNPIDTHPDGESTSAPNSSDTSKIEDTTKKEETTQKPKYSFKADLSSYEKYMNPDNRDDYLVIANRNILLGADYIPSDLTVVYKAAGTQDKYKMTYVAAMAYEALVKEAAEYGYQIVAKSGYRSYNTQKYLFQNYVNGHIKNDGMTYAEAFAYASTYSMIEGASEHQTGLTMDVNYLEQEFGNTPEGKWLAKNAHKFGFIIRYPKDKEKQTGIDWEPWHIRYVGRYHAEQMYKLNMCLEEYLVHIGKMPS